MISVRTSKTVQGFTVNTMCTSYDYSQEAIHQTLKDAGTEPIEELLDDIFVKVFLKDVNINIGKSSEKQEQTSEFLKIH